jgi:hypothetical protein
VLVLDQILRHEDDIGSCTGCTGDLMAYLLGVCYLTNCPFFIVTTLKVHYFDRAGWLQSTVSVPGPKVTPHVDGGGVHSFAVITVDESPTSPF